MTGNRRHRRHRRLYAHTIYTCIAQHVPVDGRWIQRAAGGHLSNAAA